jgi:hypothetical protein
MHAIKSVVDTYMELLETKGCDEARKYVVGVFGVEGSEDFDAESFQEFSSAVLSNIIDKAAAEKEDEATAEAVAVATEEAMSTRETPVEEATDETDA